MRLVYTENMHGLALPAGHKFPIRKYRLLRERLTGLLELVPAPLAEIQLISETHDSAYVEAFLNGTLNMRRIGFPPASR